MTAPLRTRIVELAASLRESDPELSAWILRAQIATRPRRAAKMRKVRLAQHGKAGIFYVNERMVKE